ncbi:MAG TPA: prephenate dehydrogenase/arogenate dehydrogenase family protein [Acidimicrobiales bacterium]|nr:prephenate dehydrogenase/arogenate dehydrogenase family protein [Acidimicrobiales bacterium]
MTSPAERRAHVVGLGLIGASVALALREHGWRVTGEDADAGVAGRARTSGVVTEGGLDETVTLCVVATPAGAVVESARAALATGSEHLVVTDVAGVKASIVAALDDPRFVGGHPMAGSERRGLEGARPDLFSGCTWVLTPTEATAPATYGFLHGVWRDLGANVIAVPAVDHDRLVAVASHVPHLLAGALMNEAADVAEQDAVLLQLAAGGFRDMTRVAAGDPGIWPDVLFENRAAVQASLVALERRLSRLRRALETGDRTTLSDDLHSAALARRRLPGRALHPEELSYLRVAVSDQPGVLATVTRTASEALVNIYDIEIAHGIEGTGGTLLVAVEAARAPEFADALEARGFEVGRE